MKKYLTTTLTVLFMLAAASAMAQQGRGYGCLNWSGMSPGLGLSQEQAKQFSDLQNEYFEKTAALNQTMMQKLLEKDRLLLEETPDAPKLSSLQTEISDLSARLNQIRLSCQLKARTILTAEQLARVPSGCNFGFNTMRCGNPSGYGCGKGFGRGRGPGRGHGRGCWW